MGNSDHKQQNKEKEEIPQEGHLCKLEDIINKKGEPFDEEVMVEIDGDDEGYKTPTKKEHRIAVDIRHPPPAPKKPKAQLMKRRRPSRRTLFQVSTADIELLFPVVVKESTNSNDPAANINNKVNNSNYTSSPLMSLR
uniref:Uncharacterized protein n=1 Tax=Chenopodium quinoa TaxID=63459 RepID=A0A803KRY9_CHEQI